MTGEQASSKSVHETVVEENIRLHEIEGRNYLERHPEQTNAYQARRLCRLVDGAVAQAGAELVRAEPLKNLDVACGTGYLLLQFLKRGLHCTGVDLSDRMLAALRRALPRDAGDRVEVVHQDVFEFMAAHEARFDVVSIGAALHHFDDYGSVVRWACRCVAPGGVLLIAFEPLKQAIASPLRYRAHRLLAGVDEAVYRLWAKVRGLKVDIDTSEADYQRRFGGIDPLRVSDMIEESGLSVTRVDRYCARRYGISAWIANALIGSQNSFDLVARRTCGSA